jgi:hypothetical protein
MHRDVLMAGNIYDIDRVLIRFGRDRRSSPYTRYGWIMITMLGYPLDYRQLEFIDQAVASFGKLVSWHNKLRAHGFVPVMCLYNGMDSVPVVSSLGKEIGVEIVGHGGCQSMY